MGFVATGKTKPIAVVDLTSRTMAIQERSCASVSGQKQK
jgi:hypothetical protein